MTAGEDVTATFHVNQINSASSEDLEFPKSVPNLMQANISEKRGVSDLMLTSPSVIAAEVGKLNCLVASEY